MGRFLEKMAIFYQKFIKRYIFGSNFESKMVYFDSGWTVFLGKMAIFDHKLHFPFKKLYFLFQISLFLT